MALHTVEEIKQALSTLSEEEKLQVARYALGGVPVPSVAKVSNLNKYAGKVKLGEDPLKYQQRVRAEWP